MTRLIDDTVLRTFAVVGEPEAAAAEISRRFGDIIDRFTLYTPYGLDAATSGAVVSGVHNRHTTP